VAIRNANELAGKGEATRHVSESRESGLLRCRLDLKRPGGESCPECAGGSVRVGAASRPRPLGLEQRRRISFVRPTA